MLDLCTGRESLFHGLVPSDVVKKWTTEVEFQIICDVELYSNWEEPPRAGKFAMF